MDKVALWSQVLERVEKRISKPSYETWIANTVLVDVNEESNQMTIEASNEFTRDWLESRYEELLREAVTEVTKKQYELLFSYSNTSHSSAKVRKEAKVGTATTDATSDTLLKEISLQLLTLQAEVRFLKQQNTILLEEQAKMKDEITMLSAANTNIKA